MREVLRDHPLNAGQCILPPGHEELRRQIAKRMALAGAPADPAHVVITSGTMDAITLALRVTCKPSDTVLVPARTFFGGQPWPHFSLHVPTCERVALDEILLPDLLSVDD